MHHYRAFTQFAALLSPIEAKRKRNAWTMASTVDSCNCKKRMEARVGIEPTYKGFADLSLTTWVPRLVVPKFSLTSGNSPPDGKALAGAGLGPEFWSGRRDLNPRLRPWQGRTLPLSYSRSFCSCERPSRRSGFRQQAPAC